MESRAVGLWWSSLDGMCNGRSIGVCFAVVVVLIILDSTHARIA